MADKTYTVVKGDTLGAIAKANGTTVDALLKLNPDIKDADVIGIGQVIKLSGSAGSSGSDDTTSEKIELFGVPGEPEIWKIDGKAYVIYTVPGSEPPIYLSWEVPEDDIEALFGPDVTPKYNKVIDQAQADSMGVLNFGNTNELANYDDDPFTSWAQTMETQAASQPWILDEDYQALIAMATLEGRALTDAEIQSTQWWQDHTQAEREWMKVYHGDPQTAQTMLEDNRIKTLQLLKEAGVENPSEDLVNAMADAITTGVWSVTQFNNQIKAVADPFSGIQIDSMITQYLGESTGTTMEGEDLVDSLVREWLGPVYGAWSDEDIQKWAGKIRNDPDAQQQLVAKLQAQRLSLFPGATDPTLTYDDLAQPWRSFGQNIWGQQMDETDPIFAQLINNNDAAVNGALLRKEGLDREIGTVEQSFEKQTLTGVGGTLRGVI